MSHARIIRASAKRHIVEAFHWYERQSPVLGGDFLAALETVFRRIAEIPLLYAPLYRDVRRALPPRFPYGVFYFTQSERVAVVAVLHTSGDLKLWPSRH